jgi:hypothetical protein
MLLQAKRAKVNKEKKIYPLSLDGRRCLKGG